ncbi:MAG: YggT family protein [bacterium]
MRLIVSQILDFAIYAVMVLAIFSSVMSWIPSLRWTEIGKLVFNLTDPVYMRFRKLFPPLMIKKGVAMDFSAIAAFFTFYLAYALLKKFIVPLIP